MNGKALLYYLGAGASSNVLPLASQFAERLASFAGELRKAGPTNIYGDPDAADDDPMWGKPRTAFLEAIQWLAEEASRHYSVDTFAKKLFFRRDEAALNKLKATLSAYLIVEQSKGSVDQRYDAFLATVLEATDDQYPRLPEDISIVTWNYDTQLEKAFYGFCEEDKYVLERITMNNQIYRVNGYCSAGKVGQSNIPIWRTPCAPAWETGIEVYRSYMDSETRLEPDIRFAWEKQTERVLSSAKLHVQSLSAMVVIGYSFPYFNRDIDAAIFATLSDSDMQKVYLQYPEGAHASVEERIKTLLLKDFELVRITATDYFYIPDDLWKI